jgi:hypothetical protein
MLNNICHNTLSILGTRLDETTSEDQFNKVLNLIESGN